MLKIVAEFPQTSDENAQKEMMEILRELYLLKVETCVKEEPDCE